MRPASTGEPPGEDPFLESGRERTATEPVRQSPNGGRSRSARWWTGTVGAGIVAAVLIVIILVVLFRGGGPLPNVLDPGPTAPPTPPREPLVLPLTQSSTVRLERGNPGAARDAAAAIQATLSGFYDAAFMDPETWKQGLDPSAWDAFAQPIQQRAKSDAEALTLGQAATTIESLEVTNASLSVRLLLDPRGRPAAAVATVALDATGTAGDEPVRVSNRATFLLRPSQGGWVVIGYPSATTNVQTIPPSSPGATGTPPDASASPTPGASP